MQSKTKAKVAIIGLGNLGAALASNLVIGNREVILADINSAKATDLSHQLGKLAVPMNVADAIQQSDILILAIHFSSIKEFLSEYAVSLYNKTIIDPSNPIAQDEKGSFVKTIGENESSGQILSAILPRGAKLVKAFGTLSISSLSKAAHQRPAFVQFFATNDESLHAVIDDLIRDNGFEPIHIGGLDKSIRIEVFGDLNEYGAIGRAVNFEEAKSKL